MLHSAYTSSAQHRCAADRFQLKLPLVHTSTSTAPDRPRQCYTQLGTLHCRSLLAQSYLLTLLSKSTAYTGGEATPRLNASVASLASDATRGEFIGERTVAAHVVKDSYLSMRRRGSTSSSLGTTSAANNNSSASGGVITYSKATAATRALRMEVLWTTVMFNTLKFSAVLCCVSYVMLA
jgi:hypothetical protein